ncbi:MAG: NirD/YgiW/YdeI family stress tolerance protein [bacterium]
MNKFAAVILLGVALGLSQNAEAQFVGDTTSVQTVATVKQMKDNSWFTLEGNIVKQVREERYLFRDQSGEVEVEIDSDKWKGRKVDPGTKVRITGEVEKDFLSSMEVEVKRIELIDSNVMKDQDVTSPGQ